MFYKSEIKVRCRECGHKFTQYKEGGIWLRINPSTCPKCGSRKLENRGNDIIDDILDIFGL